MQRPMLVHRLDFAPHHGDQGEVKARLERRRQLPARGVGKLRSPQFFGNRDIRRAEGGVPSQNKAIERQRRRAQGLGQLKGQRAAGKHLTGGVAGGSGIGGSEVQFHFVQRSLGIPEGGGAAFGDDLQTVVPGALA